jgi:hypothetical protein
MLTKNGITNQWEFPTMPLIHGDMLDSVKYKLFLFLTHDRFKAFFPTNFPSFQLTRDFNEYEKEDPKNKNLKGVRTYYFHAFHFRGEPYINKNKRHPYNDLAIVPKNELNKFFTKNYYEGVINCLAER